MAVDLETASLGLDRFSDDRKATTSSGALRRVPWLEEIGEQSGGDARAVVRDGNSNPSPIGVRRQVDARRGRRASGLEGVFQQVDHSVDEETMVCLHEEFSFLLTMDGGAETVK